MPKKIEATASAKGIHLSDGTVISWPSLCGALAESSDQSAIQLSSGAFLSMAAIQKLALRVRNRENST